VAWPPACNLDTIPAGGTNTNVASAFTRTPAIFAIDLSVTKPANAVGQVNQGLTCA
jgi:hypothetical protein